MKCLLEIEGKWKTSGTNDNCSYSSKSAWTNGSVRLVRSTACGLKWQLNVREQPCRIRSVKRYSANPTDRIECFGDQVKLCVKTNSGIFYLILAETSKKKRSDIVQKAKTTLGLLSYTEQGSEKMNTEEVVDLLMSDEEDVDTSETSSCVKVKKLNSSSNWLEEHDEWKDMISQTTPSKGRDSVSQTTPSGARRHLQTARSDPPKSFYSSKTSSTAPFGSNFLRPSSASKLVSRGAMATPKLSLSGVLPNKPQESTDVATKSSKDDDVGSDSENVTLMRRPSLSGFYNLGNTCYKNVALQSLLNIDVFTADLLFSYKTYEPDLEEQSLTRCLNELAICKREKRILSVQKQKDLLKAVSQAVAAYTDRYSDCQQHDAHEFFCEVLNILKEEIISYGEKTILKNSGKKAGSVNAAVDNFEFEVSTTLTCTGCSRETTIRDKQNGLTVSIPEVFLQDSPSCTEKKKLDTYIQDTINCYFQPEIIDYLCETCGVPTARSVQTFTRLPRVLVIVLKRFQNKGQITKDAQSIYINKYITLAGHCGTQVPPLMLPNIPLKLWSVDEYLKLESQSEKDNTTPGRNSGSRNASVEKIKDYGAEPMKYSAKKRLIMDAPVVESSTKFKSATVLPSPSDQSESVFAPRGDQSESIFTQVGAPKSGSKFRFKSSAIDSGNHGDKIGSSLYRDTLESSLWQQGQKKRTTSTSSTLLLDSLSEEEQCNLAIQRSLKEVGRGRSLSPLKESVDPAQFSRQVQSSKWSHSTQGLRGGHPYTTPRDLSYLVSSSDEEDVGTIQCHGQQVVAVESCDTQETGDESWHDVKQEINKKCSEGLVGGNPIRLTDSDTSPRLTNSPLPSPVSSPSLISGWRGADRQTQAYSTLKSPGKRSRLLAKTRESIKQKQFFSDSEDEGSDNSTASASRYKRRRQRDITPESTPISFGCESVGEVSPQKTKYDKLRLKQSLVAVPPTQQSLESSSQSASGQLHTTAHAGNRQGKAEHQSSSETEFDVVWMKSEDTQKEEQPAELDAFFTDEDDETWGSLPTPMTSVRDRNHLDINEVGDEESPQYSADQSLLSPPSLVGLPPGRIESCGTEASGGTVGDQGGSSEGEDKENQRPDSPKTPLPAGNAASPEPYRPSVVKTSREVKGMEMHEKGGTEFGYSYKLVGVVSHIGSESSYGHYVNDAYNVASDVWLRYDDYIVTVTDTDSVCNQRQRTAYMLLYMDSMMVGDLKTC